MAEKWIVDRYCDRCLMNGKQVKCEAQKWGNGDWRLTCSDPSCSWSFLSDADWSIGSPGQEGK